MPSLSYCQRDRAVSCQKENLWETKLSRFSHNSRRFIFGRKDKSTLFLDYTIIILVLSESKLLAESQFLFMGESGRTLSVEAVTGSKMFAKKMHRLVKKMQDKPAEGLDPLELLSEMARKKGENLSFPLEVETENQWASLLKKEGLIVVDVYSGWSGPCSSMFSILRKLKLDTNDDRMIFAAANADNISQLAPFRNQSEPCYLFIGGGKPVKVLRGSNAPKLLRTIKSEFQHELECLEGKEKRNLISIKFEASRRERSVNDAIALNQLIALEEEEKKAKLLKVEKTPTPEPDENDDKEEKADDTSEIANTGPDDMKEEKEENDNEENGEKEEEAKELDEAEQQRRELMQESNVRLQTALRPFTVIAIQSYLLETGAVTEIKDHLSEDFQLIRERYINLCDEDARKLFRIPAEIPDPNPEPPSSAMDCHTDAEDSEAGSNAENEESATSRQPSTAPTPLPAANEGSEVDENSKADDDGGRSDIDNEDEEGESSEKSRKKRAKTPVVRMIQVPIPEVLIGDTLILLLECTKVKPLTGKVSGSQDKDDDMPEESLDADHYMIARTGPEDYEEAVETQPDSLHATYGKEKYVAGLWCPRTYEDKRFVMLNYFPQFVTDMLMMPTPDPPKYQIFVYSALFSSEIMEHPQLISSMGDVIGHKRTRIKIDVAEKMLIASRREGDVIKALKWALTGQETLVISVDGRNSDLVQILDCFDPIFSTKSNLEAGYFTAKLFPDVEVLIDEDPFPPQSEVTALNLASFMDKLMTEDARTLLRQGKETDAENNT